MAVPTRICLYNPLGDENGLFREPFCHVPNTLIIDECTSWQPLQEHLRMGQADIVAVNLDAERNDAALLVVQRIAEVDPDCGIIGISASANPDTIIAAMRAGCAQFVRAPIDVEDLRTAVDRLRRVRPAAPAGCQRICVIGSSGGSGATTVACNLALELAHVTERRCALVDLNLQFGDVACAFDVHAKHTLADLCRADVEIDRTLVEMALEELPCKVSLLARPEDIEQAQNVAAEKTQEMLRVLEHMFPFAVLDLPRQFDAVTLAALNGCDQVFVVSQLAVPFLRNAMRMFDYLGRLGANEDRIHLVLNRCKATHDRVTPEEVEKQFRRPAFAYIPNDYKHIGASRDLGHPLMTDAPNSPARLAIQEMAQRIAGGDQQPGQEGRGRGIFGMFARKR